MYSSSIDEIKNHYANKIALNFYLEFHKENLNSLQNKIIYSYDMRDEILWLISKYS